jgi:anti-sigma factor RsiW
MNPVRRLRFALDHRWVPAQASGFLDGELSPRGAQRLRHHLAECPECRALLAGLRQLLGRLEGLPPPEPLPFDLAAVVSGRLHEHPG